MKQGDSSSPLLTSANIAVDPATSLSKNFLASTNPCSRYSRMLLSNTF